MTNIYDAGGIIITAQIDTTSIKGQFTALENQAIKAGDIAGKHWAKQFGNNMVSGFKAGQFGKQINKSLEEGMGNGFDAVFGKFDRAADRSTRKAKASFGSFGKSLAKGGVIGIGLEALNYAIGAVITKFVIGKDHAMEFTSALQQIHSTLNSYSTVQNQLAIDTELLKSKTDDLNRSISNTGIDAQKSARLEIEAIHRRISKNRELQRLYLDDLRIQKQKAMEAAEKADNQGLAKAAARNGTSYYSGAFEKEDVKESFLARLRVELKGYQDKIDAEENLTKIESRRHEKLVKYFTERFHRAQEIQNIEEKISILSEPVRATENSNEVNVDGTKPKQRHSRFPNVNDDEKVRRIEARQKATAEPKPKPAPLPAPADTQVEDEAARQAEAEAELHRQRIEQAKELKRQAEGPIADYRDALADIRKIEQNDEAKETAGGDNNIGSAKLDALRELASATENYGIVLNELDTLLKADEITVEQYGQAFQDVIQSISDTDKALELLGTRAQNDILGDSPIKKAAIDEANKSLKTSEEYLEAINAEKREALELEAQEIENKLLLAEIGEGEPIDVKAFRERLAIIRERLDLMQRGFSPEAAEDIAPKLVRSSEYNDLEGDVKDLFKGGIKAAIDGDFEDFLAGKLQSAADSMFDNALDTLLDGLLGAGGALEGLIGSLFGGEGGGGLDSLIGSLFGGGGKSAVDDAAGGAANALGDFSASTAAATEGLGGFGGLLGSLLGGGGSGGLLGVVGGLFAGFFADGGVVPRGQFAIVGEQGPEIISSGASPLRVTPMNDNIATSHAARLTPDGGGMRAMSYAPVNNFYGHTQDDLRRSLDQRDRALKSEMPGLMDRHSFNRKRGMA